LSVERRRGEYDIYADIVETIAKKDLCSLTRVSYGANLPVDRAKKFMQLLISHGFVRESIVDDHVKYRATKRGLEYVETFKRMRKFFAALDEPIAVDMPEPLETALPGRVKTGYKDLDSLLLGGIPENYAVVLTSPSCDERDLLVKRFIGTGVNEKQVAFYITTDVARSALLAKELKSHFYLCVCNPQADKIIKRSPTVFKTKGVENLTDINIALNSAFSSLGSIGKQPRVCIDLISDVLLQHRAVTTRRWLAALVPELKTRRFTTLAVMNPYMHSPEEVQAVLGLFEGELDIYDKGEDAGKCLKVKKLFGQRYLNSPIAITKEELEKRSS
jgi:predicted transcriptional regulator/KaiC/GvpD/RAD55 family RecA-like ATPase